ncbi:MAG: hypothetical protein H0W06_08015 [Chloroflexia bacterium]|nr:hypothetical protein [Chloroflexia bacterium]
MGKGLIGRRTTTGAATYAHADGLGSVRLLTDATGSVVGSQQYDAFGSTRAQSGVQLPFTYTGDPVDAESGLVSLRARYMGTPVRRLRRLPIVCTNTTIGAHDDPAWRTRRTLRPVCRCAVA